jgi:hypothetical protein
MRQAIGQLIDHYSKRPDVHGWSIFFALVNLGRKIECYTAQCGQIFACSYETEVGKFDIERVSRLDKHIGWLDVSMYERYNWFFAFIKVCQR